MKQTGNGAHQLPDPAAVSFDLNRIIPFVILAEELSFTRAAKRLIVDHTWLSRQIGHLEKQLGFVLFFRNTRNVQLSPEGKEFLSYAQDVMSAVLRAEGGLAQLARQRDATFTFGVMPFTYWIPARNWIIRELESRAPGAAINIVPKGPEELIEDAANGTIDAAILDSSRPLPATLRSHVIHRAQPGLLVPAEDELALQPIIEASDLKGRQIAVNDPSLWPGHHTFYACLKEAGAVPVIIPEGRRAMAFYARREKLIFVTFSWPHSDLVGRRDFVFKLVSPPLDIMEYIVISRQEDTSAIGMLFWRLVTSISTDRLNVSEL